MALTRVTYSLIEGAAVNPLDYGADPSGVADSTAAINAAVVATPAGKALVFSPGTYKITAPVLVDKGIKICGIGAQILCSGATAYFNVSGTGINGLQFLDLKLYGDGTTGNTPAGGAIQSPSGTETQDWIIDNCTFEDLSFGVAINSNLSGYHRRPVVKNCHFVSMVGSSSGTGIGLNFAGGNVNVMDAIAEGNVFSDIGRHSLYVSSGSNISIVNNVFQAQSNATERIAACAVARARNVLIANNAFYANSVGVSVEPAESAVVAQNHPDTRAVNVVGNLFRDTARYDILVGTEDTASGTRGIYDVRISDNLIYKTDDANYAGVLILNGNKIVVEDNLIDATQVSVNYTFGAIYLAATPVTGQTSSDYAIRNNKIVCALTGGSITDTRGINLGDSNVKAIKLLIAGNDISAITKIHNYTSLGALTQTSAGLTGLVGIYTAGDTSPNVDGISFMRVANSGATSITQFDNGVDGQELTLLFADSNTTITRANAYFQSGSDYTSAVNSTLKLVSYNSKWYEIARETPS
jgi:hypothetical protein